MLMNRYFWRQAVHPANVRFPSTESNYVRPVGFVALPYEIRELSGRQIDKTVTVRD